MKRTLQMVEISKIENGFQVELNWEIQGKTKADTDYESKVYAFPNIGKATSFISDTILKWWEKW